jgi:hypothetical protein
MGEGDADNLLGLLMRYSMVDFKESSSRYEMHDLLAEFACSQMVNGEEASARLKHASHYKEVLRTANGLYMKSGDEVMIGLRLFDLEWENIRVGQAWASETRKSSNESSRLCIYYPNGGVEILNLRQHPSDRILWLESALNAAREIRDINAQYASVGNLGDAYANFSKSRI